MSPRDVDESTLFEFACAVDGYVKANSAEDKAPAMSDDKLRELGVAGF